MPPKRKAPAAKKATPAKKKKVAEEEAGPPDRKSTIAALKTAETGKMKTHKVDAECGLGGSSVSNQSTH